MSGDVRAECACMDRCRGKCGLREAIQEAKARVASMLPEDEPDYTSAWVYRAAIEEGVKLTAVAVARSRGVR